MPMYGKWPGYGLTVRKDMTKFYCFVPDGKDALKTNDMQQHMKHLHVSSKIHCCNGHMLASVKRTRKDPFRFDLHPAHAP